MQEWVSNGFHRGIANIGLRPQARIEAPGVFRPFASGATLRPAVFLDRDGTIIKHVHHLRRPSDVVLVEGAANVIRELQKQGYLCVLVTNQSVVGRGMLTDAGLTEVHNVLRALLASESAHLDGIYTCPIVPRLTDPTVVEHADRKPGPGMLLRASAELGIDLSRSWMVGDAISDVFAGRNAGCRRTVLIGKANVASRHESAIDHRVSSLAQVVDLVVAHD